MKSLDEKVAEKMGWEQKERKRKGPMCGEWIETYWEAPECPSRGTETFMRGCRRGLPKFSSDWNATNIVIKFMRERGYQPSVTPIVGRFDLEFHWLMMVEENHGEHGIEYIPEPCIQGIEIIDDNLPLAACEAFLQIDLEVK